MTRGIAFLGSGLATQLHSKTLKAISPNVHCWYASRDPNLAKRTSERFNAAGHFLGYADAVNSPEVDVILIALPPALHLEWTLKALEAGKHVIVEKPPFRNTQEMKAVEEAARKAGKQIMVAENYFYKPLTSLLRRIIGQGELGNIRFIHLNALKYQQTNNWRDQSELACGGALFEGGIHWINLLANISLTPCRIQASLPGKALPGTERNALVTIEYEEGAVASLFYSWDLSSVINGVRFSKIYGTLGSIWFETNGTFACITGRHPRIVVGNLRDLSGHKAMLIDFFGAIEENRSPLYDFKSAYRDLELIEQAYSSVTS